MLDGGCGNRDDGEEWRGIVKAGKATDQQLVLSRKGSHGEPVTTSSAFYLANSF